MLTLSRAAMAWLLSLALIGCTTTQAISYNQPGELYGKVQVGDRVELLHESGRQLRFKVTEVTKDSISGDGNTILWESIEGIKIRKFSGGKTAAAAGATSGVVLAGVAVLGVIALGQAFEGFGEAFSKIFTCMFGGCKDDDDS